MNPRNERDRGLLKAYLCLFHSLDSVHCETIIIITGGNNTGDDNKSRFSIILHNLVPNLLSKFLNNCLAPSPGPNTVSLCHWFTLSAGLIPDKTVHHSSFNLKPRMVLHWNWRWWTLEQCPPPHGSAYNRKCPQQLCKMNLCYTPLYCLWCRVTQAGEERIDVHCSASSTVFCITCDAAYCLS